ncbi:hypothetical protein C7S13_3413 [Burkholderia cepacia]|nr:hypothetical protein [Burkholderia cepacia]
MNRIGTPADAHTTNDTARIAAHSHAASAAHVRQTIRWTHRMCALQSRSHAG